MARGRSERERFEMLLKEVHQSEGLVTLDQKIDSLDEKVDQLVQELSRLTAQLENHRISV